MQLHSQAELLRSCEQSLDLPGIERDGFAVGIDGICEILAGDGRKYFVDDMVHVGVGVAGELGRNGMGRKQGRTNGQPGDFAEPAGDAKHLEFTLQIEPVAGLDLHRCHSLAHKCLQPGERIGIELLFAGCPGCRDGRQDAATLRRNVLIADAAQTPLVLFGPMPAEHEVRVAVDEGGGEPSTRQGTGLRGVPPGEIRSRTDPVDFPAGNRDRAGFDRAVVWCALPHRGDAGVRQQQIPVGHYSLRNCKAT